MSRAARRVARLDFTAADLSRTRRFYEGLGFSALGEPAAVDPAELLLLGRPAAPEACGHAGRRRLGDADVERGRGPVGRGPDAGGVAARRPAGRPRPRPRRAPRRAGRGGRPLKGPLPRAPKGGEPPPQGCLTVMAAVAEGPLTTRAGAAAGLPGFTMLCLC